MIKIIIIFYLIMGIILCSTMSIYTIYRIVKKIVPKWEFILDTVVFLTINGGCIFALLNIIKKT